jgi:uncharacterized protein (TIGR03437 family)
MKKLIAIFGMLLAMSGVGMAQTNVVGSSVRVYTEPSSNARFMVDGLTYFGSQTFTWPKGSKHVIEFPLHTRVDGTVDSYQESLDKQSQFAFGGWLDSNGINYSGMSAITVVADTSLTFIKATVNPAYRVTLRFSRFPVTAECSPGTIPQDYVRTGFILMNNTCYGSDTESFMPGGVLNLQAIPFPGSVFLGWSVNGSTSTGAVRTVPIVGPITIAASFTQSKRVQFLTDPPALNVLVDRSPTPTSDRNTHPDDRPGLNNPTCQSNLNLPPNPPITIPVLCFGEFDFIPGSKHVIGAVSPQYSRTGEMYVFDKFSNGMGDNAVYTASNDLSGRELLTAKFLPGVNVAFLTNPPNLKLSIDKDATLFLNYNFAWGIGHTHTVTAPAQQRDARGRLWTFKSWSNGGPATQTITVTGPLRLTAEYEAQPQVQITSTPAGLPLIVDGAECTTPCTVDKAPGTELRVTAPNHISVTPQSRYQFQGWGDSDASSRTITMDSDRQVFNAQYLMAHQLTTIGEPTSGVTFSMEPSTTDGFYTLDTAVRVRADVKNGFKFKRWDGDLAGSFNQGTVVMSSPRTVFARLDKVPFIPPAGIRNAAGETPDGTVAPGSIISIIGESLAAEYESGRTNPLPQTIGNVTVRVGDSLLPLLWVSPTEIRAQVLSTLADGQHDLRVRWEGNPEVTGKFTVSRNSPGLFSRDDEPVALATHEDGSQITPNSPAKRGEMITLYGTGFGPYERTVIDGFLNTLATGNALVDRLEVYTGERLILPDFSGAAPSAVGLAVTRFRIPDDLESTDAPPQFRVSVNGRSSNSVVIPVQQ